MTCPTCNGHGDTEVEFYAGHGRLDYRYETCGECGGAGTLDGPLPTWLDGDYQRDARDGF